MRIIEKYTDFLRKPFDKNALNKILSLNDDKDFKDNGITIKLCPLESDFKKLRTLGREIQMKGAENVIKAFKILYEKFNYDNFYRYEDAYMGPLYKNLGVYQKLDKYIYRISRRYNEISWSIIDYLSDERNDYYFGEYTVKNESTNIDNLILDIKLNILSNYKVALEAHNKFQEEKNKNKSDLDKFKEKYGNQFILDEFSNVFDLCKSYKIEDIGEGQMSGRYPIKIHLFFDQERDIYHDDYVGWNNDEEKYQFASIDSVSSEIISELMATADRLKEHGFKLFFSPNKNGATVALRRMVKKEEKIIEGFKDFFKKPLDRSIIDSILDINNLERVKKLNIQIEKIDHKSERSGLLKVLDQAAASKGALFKVIYPEKILYGTHWDFSPELYNSLYLGVKESNKVKNKYLFNVTPFVLREFDDFFYSNGHDNDTNFYQHNFDELFIGIENTICSALENKRSEEDKKKSKETSKEKFFRKYDEETIKNIFLDIISIFPDSSIYKNNEMYVFHAKISNDQNIKLDSKISSLFEEIPIAKDRLEEIGLESAISFTPQSNVGTYLNINIYKKIKPENE